MNKKNMLKIIHVVYFVFVVLCVGWLVVFVKFGGFFYIPT